MTGRTCSASSVWSRGKFNTHIVIKYIYYRFIVFAAIKQFVKERKPFLNINKCKCPPESLGHEWWPTLPQIAITPPVHQELRGQTDCIKKSHRNGEDIVLFFVTPYISTIKDFVWRICLTLNVSDVDRQRVPILTMHQVSCVHFPIDKFACVLFRWKLYRFLVWKYQHVLAKKMKTLQTMYTDLVKLGEDLK